MALRKKKLGERIGASLTALKGSEEAPQVFSIISDLILSYDYHYDDVYGKFGRFMCMSEFDDNGKMVKKAQCCKIFKRRQDRVIVPVIAYEGRKKSYRKLADGKIKYLSITSFKYNQLCKELDDAGIDFADCSVDLLLKCEDEKRGKISFEIIDSNEPALWQEDESMKDLVKEAMATWEEDILASLPTEYSAEDFARLVEEAEEEGEAPEGVEASPKKSSTSDIPKKKKKVVEDDEDEDETPKKKKKSLKEQIDEEDFDNEDLDEEEDEAPKKKKKVVEEDEDDEEDFDDEPAPKKKKKVVEEDDEDEDFDDEDE